MEEKQLLEEMVSKAESAPDPGETRKGQVVSDGKDTPPSIVKSIESAGYVYIYDNRTGERSITNRNMLPTQLKKVRPDGSKVFTTSDPKIVLKRGTTKCLLHPESVDRSHYDDLGLPVCKKSNIKNDHELEGHMKSKHKREWETIKAERAEIEKQEDRRQMSKLLAGLTGIKK